MEIPAFVAVPGIHFSNEAMGDLAFFTRQPRGPGRATPAHQLARAENQTVVVSFVAAAFFSEIYR